MNKFRKLVVVAALVLSILAPVEMTYAQAKGAVTSAKRPEGPKKVIRLDEMKVEGRIQKPQAIFLMPRSNLNYGDLDRAEPFMPKVTKAVEKEPF